MIFDEESAGDAQKILAPPKRMILQNKIDAKKKVAKKRKKVEVTFGPKNTSKTQTIVFTPSPRLVKKK